jgi:hypothetical protein
VSACQQDRPHRTESDDEQHHTVVLVAQLSA